MENTFTNSIVNQRYLIYKAFLSGKSVRNFHLLTTFSVQVCPDDSLISRKFHQSHFMNGGASNILAKIS